MSSLRALLFLTLVCVSISCKTNKPQVDLREKEAKEKGQLVVFCSNKGQLLAPIAAAIFNKKAAAKNLPFYAVHRSTNPYDPNLKTIPAKIQEKILAKKIALSSTNINPLIQADIDSAMSLVHLGPKPLAFQKEPRINVWQIPTQISDLDTKIELIGLSSDNLIAVLLETE